MIIRAHQTTGSLYADWSISPLDTAILAVGVCLSAGAACGAGGGALCAEPPPSVTSDAADAGKRWSARPIPQRRADVEYMRDRVSTLTALAGVVASPARDGEVLVYGDAPDGERTVVAHDMQQLVATVAGWIEAEPGCAVHWHPVVLFEFSRRESYELLEAAGFDAVDVDGPAAAVHVEGPAAYVVIGPASGSPFPRDVLRAKAMVRAALYQSHGPEPLPAWAESGLAWYWAISTRDGDADDAALRRPGLRFIRNGGSVVDVLNASGSHDDDVAFDLIESIGYLAVRAMMQRDAEATAGWARDVMAGSNWRDAMESAMGRSLGRFGRELASWHRVND